MTIVRPRWSVVAAGGMAGMHVGRPMPRVTSLLIWRIVVRRGGQSQLRHKKIMDGAHFSPKVIKMPKIPQHQKYHGIFYCHIVNNLRDIWQINLIGLLRYGNRDILNLATLKNKIQFHYILSIFKKNLKSNLILSHTLNFLSKNLTEMWQPWCQKIYFIIMWCHWSVKHHSDFMYQLPTLFLFLH